MNHTQHFSSDSSSARPVLDIVQDIWVPLRAMFCEARSTNPELTITGLDPAQVRQFLRALLEQAREVNVSLVDADGDAVWAPSVGMACNLVSEGYLRGALGLKLVAVPSLMVYMDAPHTLGLAPVGGDGWTVVSALAFFMLLRDLIQANPKAEIWLDESAFVRDERIHLARVVEWLVYD